MVIVKLTGGLGNQMFQYAAGRRLALVNNSPLKLDLSWFADIPPKDTPRHYELSVFNSVQDVASPAEVKELRGVDISRWPKVLKQLSKTTGLFTKQSGVREKSFSFDPGILALRGDFHLDGYWQSAKYFLDVEDVIRRDFTFGVTQNAINRETGNVIQKTESVSLHIRRGDYVTGKSAAQHHGSCSLEYYRSAVAEISGRLHNPYFFVFSDDPSWVREHLRLAVPLIFVEHNSSENGYEDLRLMSLCRHHIIANSSFSWWGAWLSSHPEKNVIAPQKWFKLADMDASDLLPDNWLLL